MYSDCNSKSFVIGTFNSTIDDNGWTIYESKNNSKYQFQYNVTEKVCKMFLKTKI